MHNVTNNYTLITYNLIQKNNISQTFLKIRWAFKKFFWIYYNQIMYNSNELKYSKLITVDQDQDTNSQDQ